MRSRESKTFIGNTALMSSLSCDSVIAGAFFPQSDSHVPEEEVSQHTGDHMVSPPRKFSHLVMVHPQIGLGLLEALFDSPANPREPDKGLQSGGSTRIGDEEGVCGILSDGTANKQPDPFVRHTVFGQNHPFLHKLIGHGTLRSLGDLAAIPEIVVRALGQFLKRDRLGRCCSKNPLLSFFSPVAIGLLQDGRLLSPAEGIQRQRNKIRHPRRFLHRVYKFRAATVNRIRHDIPEGDDLLILTLE